jgi:hypothetical protein
MRRSKRSWREPLGVAFVLILSLTMGFAGELMALNLDQEVLNAEDLDALILNHESQLQGLRRGTEKSILWYDENQKEKTPWSIVYLHGFSASRREISPVVETLAKNLKANVFFYPVYRTWTYRSRTRSGKI